MSFTRSLLSRTATHLLGGVLCAGALVAAGCDDGAGDKFKRDGVPDLEANTTKFTFPKLSVAEGGACPEGAICQADRRIRLQNIGTGTLKLAGIKFDGVSSDRMTDLALYWDPSADGDTAQYTGYSAAEGWQFPQVVDIQPNEYIELILNYTPSFEGDLRGAVVFETNDPNDRNVRLEIATGESGPEINVTPRTIDFGRVPAGREATETITVMNIGQSTLTFDAIALEQIQSDFSVTIGDVDPSQDTSILADPDRDGSPGLDPNKSFQLTVHYLTEVEGPDEGSVVIVSNDPSSPTTIILKANGATPCINVNPEELVFPPALVGRTTARPVNIESCGGEPLQLANVYLKDDSSPAYVLQEGLPDFPSALQPFVEGQPAPSLQVIVELTPEDEAAYGGTLVIESDDPLTPVIEVPLVGRGTINECPIAEVAQAEYNVLPLDIVTLDGSPSSDSDGPNGQPVRYEWVVVERPDGSTAVPVERFFNPARPADGGPADDTATPAAQFFVDLAGHYVIELRVTDNNDIVAPSDVCPQEPARIEINAVPDEDIHVQLVWSTPGDPDETDGEGSDVDLHFLHPRGREWMVAPLDCYYANVAPDWGPQGPPGNPSLDIDDTNGAGPENINVNEPEDTSQLGGTYRVGIHYYRAEDFLGGGSWGPSEATTRIFLAGQQAGEWVHMLQRTDDFCEVASIIWTPADKRVQEINRCYRR